jgi:hypothetical protein
MIGFAIFLGMFAIALVMVVAVLLRIELNKIIRWNNQQGRDIEALLLQVNAIRVISATTQENMLSFVSSFHAQRDTTADHDMRIKKLEMFVDNVKDNAKKIREQQEEHKRQIQSRLAR